MKHLVKVALGLVLMLTSIWVLAYALTVIDDWAKGPAAITAGVFSGLGAFVALYWAFEFRDSL